jgi:hypothetical protein
MQATSLIILAGFLQLVVDALWCIVMLEIKDRILLVGTARLVVDSKLFSDLSLEADIHVVGLARSASKVDVRGR